mgnify:CR=1 FL=1
MYKKSSRAAVTGNSSFTSFKLHAYIVKSNDIATSGWGNAYMDGIEYKGGQGSWATTSGTFYLAYHRNAIFWVYQ